MCGATSKRTGQPCRRKDLFASGRCKFHGGMSTGPRSVAGKERSARNGGSTRQGQVGANGQPSNEPHEGLTNPKV
nr:HGGxSTG domain-containing protein [Pigmentiphaga aceris]